MFSKGTVPYIRTVIQFISSSPKKAANFICVIWQLMAIMSPEMKFRFYVLASVEPSSPLASCFVRAVQS